MNDRFNKYSNDPISNDREDKEKFEKEKIERHNYEIDNNDPINRDINRTKNDTDAVEKDEKGLLDKVVEFFTPEKEEPMNTDENTTAPLYLSDSDKEPMVIYGDSGVMDSYGIDTRDSGMMESDQDNGDRDKVLVGIFDTENEAINVITRLNQIGYWEDEITAIAKDKNQMDYIDDAAIGGSLGGLALALPTFGLVAIDGIGPILAAGPIASALGGVVGGGITGGLVDGMVQLGVSEEDASEYEQYIQEGKILLLVENKDSLQEDVTSTFTQNNSLISDRIRTREFAGIMR